MDLNFVDAKDIRVSDELQYQINKIDDVHPVIIVDIVLENPHGFIENIVQKTPLQFNNKVQTSDIVFPGHQVHLGLDFPEINLLVGHLIQKYTDFTQIEQEDLVFSYQINVMNSDVEVERICMQPHVDPAMFAFVIYLNEPEQCRGGTSFFSHSACGVTNMEHVHKPFKRTEEYWNLKEWLYDFKDKKFDKIDCDSMLMEDVYEEEYFVPMQFNMLILYPSNVWHTAMMKKGWYNHDQGMDRVSISGFIHPDCFGVS